MKILGTKQITLLVKPHSKKNYITQLDPDTVEIAISSKPEKGKANKEIIEKLAKFFGVNKNQIQIVRGHKSKRKVIQIIET